MAHLDTEERSQLEVQRWVAAAFTTVAAGVWVAFAIDNESDDGDATRTITYSAAAAASLGWTVATLLASDAYAARTVGAWGVVTEIIFAGVALGFAVGAQSCGRDCPRFLGAFALSSFVNAAAIAALELFAPPIFVSKQYEHYRRLPDSERGRYGLDLLLAQESRARTQQYVAFGAAAIGALGLAGAAMTAETEERRLAFAAVAAINFSVAAVTLIVNLLERRPSEKLLLGEPPARPEAF